MKDPGLNSTNSIQNTKPLATLTLTEAQEKLYDNFYVNRSSSAETNAYFDGQMNPAVMSSTRLSKIKLWIVKI